MPSHPSLPSIPSLANRVVGQSPVCRRRPREEGSSQECRQDHRYHHHDFPPKSGFGVRKRGKGWAQWAGMLGQRRVYIKSEEALSLWKTSSLSPILQIYMAVYFPLSQTSSSWRIPLPSRSGMAKISWNNSRPVRHQTKTRSSRTR